MKKLLLIILCCFALGMAMTATAKIKNVSCPIDNVNCDILTTSKNVIYRKIIVSFDLEDSFTLQCNGVTQLGPYYFGDNSGLASPIKIPFKAGDLGCANGQVIRAVKGILTTPATITLFYD